MTLRVIVAGDIRLYRDGVATYLHQPPRFEVVGAVGSREEVRDRVRALRPDVLVLDMAMRDALETARDLAELAPEVKVVALTVPEVERAVIACAEAGVAGYLRREGSLDDLVATIERAVRGETVVPPRIAAGLFRRMAALAAQRRNDDALVELTAREREVVLLLDGGLSNKQIAARLQIELATVKNHVHNILEKLHVSRRGEIAARLRHDAPASRLFDADRAAELEI